MHGSVPVQLDHRSKVVAGTGGEEERAAPITFQESSDGLLT